MKDEEERNEKNRGGNSGRKEKFFSLLEIKATAKELSPRANKRSRQNQTNSEKLILHRRASRAV
jgi:hypothetical protein